MTDERAQFEAWYSADAMPCEADWFKRDPQHPEMYDDASTHGAWRAWQAAREQAAPIDMILYCPACGLQHVDAPDERTPDWKNEPHRSHLCHRCGNIWRPADVATNGVARIKTKGKADTVPGEQAAHTAQQKDDDDQPS